MNTLAPVYSINANCRDCYTCVRRCPVKAIRVENDHAVVIPDRCIFCGKCVLVCPARAKQVRDDLPKARALVHARRDVILSLAPSFAAEFPGATAAQLAAACKRLGFAQVRETAEGADLVSRAVAELIVKSPGHRLQISTACPVVVELVRQYHPRFAAYLTPVMSPVMAHCAILRRHEHTPIVFAGPCVGKKSEADSAPAALAAALTFEELRQWLTLAGIDRPESTPPDPAHTLPGDGAYYPVEGGMIRSVERCVRELSPGFRLTAMTLSGLGAIGRMLETLNPAQLGHPLFIEALACPGGCVCGPKTRARCAASGFVAVMQHAARTAPASPPDLPVKRHYRPAPLPEKHFAPGQIEAALRTLGKHKPADELNCGGCGYDTCRDLARALACGDAEPQMCVSYMRQLAQKKSLAIDRALPYGLVVAGENLRVIECNERFARMMGEEMAIAYENRPGLRDADLSRLLPGNLLRSVLETGEEIMRKIVRREGRLFSVTVFNVEPHTVVGALVLDVTESESRRRQLIEKARTVVQNTSKTVQEIAFMLGRNAAQSELILNSAVDMFAPVDQEEEPVK